MFQSKIRFHILKLMKLNREFWNFDCSHRYFLKIPVIIDGPRNGIIFFESDFLRWRVIFSQKIRFQILQPMKLDSEFWNFNCGHRYFFKIPVIIDGPRNGIIYFEPDFLRWREIFSQKIRFQILKLMKLNFAFWNFYFGHRYLLEI